MNYFPMRGEIWWTDLNPTRPCLVVSRDEFNRTARTVPVIPITSGSVRYPGSEVALDKSTGLDIGSCLVLPQIRIAAKERLKNKIGKITSEHFFEGQFTITNMPS